MVGLFEQWETWQQKKSRKTHLKKIDVHFNESYKYLIPINQQDFWLPGVLYTGNKLRLGALS